MKEKRLGLLLDFLYFSSFPFPHPQSPQPLFPLLPQFAFAVSDGTDSPRLSVCLHHFHPEGALMLPCASLTPDCLLYSGVLTVTDQTVPLQALAKLQPPHHSPSVSTFHTTPSSNLQPFSRKTTLIQKKWDHLRRSKKDTSAGDSADFYISRHRTEAVGGD